LAFDREVCLFSVCLRAYRDVFTSAHGQGPGNKPGEASHQDLALRSVRSSDAEHQAGNRQDTIICAEHSGAKPPRSVGAVRVARHAS